MKPLAQQTLVLTGASSGIGLATAEQAAAAGARLVIVGRDEGALQALAQRLQQRHGTTVLPVAADMADRAQVEQVAAAAIARFGGFDTWINNAGVGQVGSLLEHWDEPTARRLMETNFWGTVNGSLVAVAHLRRRGGTLVNMGSILSDLSVPLQTMYCASKHAVKGFTDGLRQELLADGAPVAVVLVKPASVATPLIEHAAHPPGRHPRLVSPLYDPEDAARAVLDAAQRPQREVQVGGAAVMATAVAALAPALVDVAAPLLASRQWRDEPSPGSAGNLFQPSFDSHGRSVGHHPGQHVMPSVWNRVAAGVPAPLQAAPGLLVGALAGGAWLLAQALRARPR